MEKKIAFFLDKTNLGEMDLSSFQEGNPGLGGTDYEFILVSQHLNKRRNNLNVLLLTRSKLPNYIHSQYVSDIAEACEYCKKNNIQIFVVNQSEYEKIPSKYKSNFSLILWAHNDISNLRLKKIYKDSFVRSVVFCGREFMELYYDNIVMKKSTYIYNIIPFHDREWYKERITSKTNHNVVYMAAITPAKGFDVLAKAWPYILKKVPDAQLYVIGSFKVYGKQTKLGKYGVAIQEYEDVFMPYLTDDEGVVLPSVHFLGLMGVEKEKILGKCKVGIPNPTGYSECLPLSVIEMQLMGCSITTIKHHAFLDTVFNQNYLYKEQKKLADYVVKRLLDPADDYNCIYQFITEKFDAESSLIRWENLLFHGGYTTIERISEEKYHCKQLKSFILKCKLLFPILENLPSIESIITWLKIFYTYHMRSIRFCKSHE